MWFIHDLASRWGENIHESQCILCLATVCKSRKSLHIGIVSGSFWWQKGWTSEQHPQLRASSVYLSSDIVLISAQATSDWQAPGHLASVTRHIPIAHRLDKQNESSLRTSVRLPARAEVSNALEYSFLSRQ